MNAFSTYVMMEGGQGDNPALPAPPMSQAAPSIAAGIETEVMTQTQAREKALEENKTATTKKKLSPAILLLGAIIVIFALSS